MQQANYAAYGPRGNVLATFNALDLAERYRDEAAHIGVKVVIRRVIEQRRAA